MAHQLAHIETTFKKKGNELILICQGINSPANIGGMFRISEAFGITELIFCGSEINLNSSRLQRTARSTIANVNHRIEENIEITISTLKNEGYLIAALEITKKSLSLKSFKFPENKPIALIVGGERNGISEDILESSHCHVHIDMFGKNSSINVVTATAIALYSFTNI